MFLAMAPGLTGSIIPSYYMSRFLYSEGGGGGVEGRPQQSITLTLKTTRPQVVPTGHVRPGNWGHSGPE